MKAVYTQGPATVEYIPLGDSALVSVDCGDTVMVGKTVTEYRDLIKYVQDPAQEETIKKLRAQKRTLIIILIALGLAPLAYIGVKTLIKSYLPFG